MAGIPELLDDLELVEPDAAGRPAAGGRPSLDGGPGRCSADRRRAVARALAEGATTVDELAARTGLPVATVLGTLTLLEIRGLVVGGLRALSTGRRARGGAPPGLP